MKTFSNVPELVACAIRRIEAVRQTIPTSPTGTVSLSVEAENDPRWESLTRDVEVKCNRDAFLEQARIEFDVEIDCGSLEHWEVSAGAEQLWDDWSDRASIDREGLDRVAVLLREALRSGYMLSVAVGRAQTVLRDCDFGFACWVDGVHRDTYEAVCEALTDAEHALCAAQDACDWELRQRRGVSA